MLLHAIRTDAQLPLSSGMFDDRSPRWDPAGKYLYLLSRRNLNPVLSEIDFEHALVDMAEVFVLPLSAATPPPILAVASAAGFDLEAWAKGPKSEKDGKDADEANDGGDAAAMVAPEARRAKALLQIDTDGMADRLVRLEIEPGELSDLEAVPGGRTLP